MLNKIAVVGGGNIGGVLVQEIFEMPSTAWESRPCPEKPLPDRSPTRPIQSCYGFFPQEEGDAPAEV